MSAHCCSLLVAVVGEYSNVQKNGYLHFVGNTIKHVPVAQIPMSKYGLSQAIGSSKYLQDLDRNRIVNSLSGICEYLFTYVNENEVCDLFGLFHFYCLKDTGAVFKISEMGILQGIEALSPNSYRIAYTSELCIDEDELYS